MGDPECYKLLFVCSGWVQGSQLPEAEPWKMQLMLATSDISKHYKQYQHSYIYIHICIQYKVYLCD